jgi:hypothetical protein
MASCCPPCCCLILAQTGLVRKCGKCLPGNAIADPATANLQRIAVDSILPQAAFLHPIFLPLQGMYNSRLPSVSLCVFSVGLRVIAFQSLQPATSNRKHHGVDSIIHRQLFCHQYFAPTGHVQFQASLCEPLCLLCGPPCNCLSIPATGNITGWMALSSRQLSCYQYFAPSGI